MSNEEGFYTFKEIGAEISPKVRKALEVLRRLGLTSATEGKIDEWAVKEVAGKDVVIHPWGKPGVYDREEMLFTVFDENSIPGREKPENPTMVRFDRISRTAGKNSPNIYILSEVTDGNNIPEKWGAISIENMGDIKSCYFRLADDGESIRNFSLTGRNSEGEEVNINVKMDNPEMEEAKKQEKLNRGFDQLGQMIGLTEGVLKPQDFSVSALINACMIREGTPDQPKPIDSAILQKAIIRKT
jgi:hypothetical protein